MEKEDICCIGPVKTSFEGNDVSAVVHVGVEAKVDRLMERFPIGSVVKVKCRLGFTLEDHTLSLIYEDGSLISGVKVVVE